MGRNIDSTEFSSDHFQEFGRRLQQETEWLLELSANHQLDQRQRKIGFELEAWLLDKNAHPAPVNERYLVLANNPLLSPELSQFNIELNTLPQVLQGDALARSQRLLTDTWSDCITLGQNMDISLGLFGILPTLQPSDLNLEQISNTNRFAALNRQIISQRKGRPLKVEISGYEHLRIEHPDVMLESAATSFQVHLQVPAEQAVRYYNASLLLSAISVAVAANSPFLFGKQLISETRIPLFEQAVEVGGYAGAAQGPLKRVGFGSSYLKQSIGEAFVENVQHFPVLLPTLFDAPLPELQHLRLHNGTIWRWNRPLIDFNADGQAHIRIEHRVMPAGPSLIDMWANAAFYYGLVHVCAQQWPIWEQQINFATAKDNFYKAAQQGLNTRIKWQQDKIYNIRKLILRELLPMAREGLQDLRIAGADCELYLDIIKERVANERTGSDWQIEFVRRTGCDMQLLTESYLQQQQSNQPVHTWELPSLPKHSQAPSLVIADTLPAGFLESSARDLHRLLNNPTLFILPGEIEQAVFVSVLLHGNENSGLLAVQQLLRKYAGKRLPRSLILFVGNVSAARYGLRRLNNQADYNRVWPGTDVGDSPERELMQQVYEQLEQQSLFVSIDIHNNTGHNPHYACVNYLEAEFLRLALLFSRTVVYFNRPLGVQSIALAQLCPATTIECGKVGDQKGIVKACNLLDSCLHLGMLSGQPVKPQDIDLFHTVAQVKIPERIRFSFEDDPADIHFSHDLEYMNFREITTGTPFGDCAKLEQAPLIVLNEHGNDVYNDYFEVNNGLLRLRKNITPSMLSCNERVIRQDCFCYLMERIKLS